MGQSKIDNPEKLAT